MTETGNYSPPADCPSLETLAAYVDGRISAAERSRLSSHLAACETCFDVVAEVVRTEQALAQDGERPVAGTPVSRSAQPAAEVRPAFRMRRAAVAAGGLAALAATLLVAVNLQRDAVSPLAAIVGPERPVVARLTGGFEYGPVRSPFRGAAPDDDRRLRLMAEVARLRETARRTAAAADLHALAVGELLAGDTAASLEAFRSVTDPGSLGARFDADLGAAWMTQYLDTRSPEAAANALAAIDRALAREPDLLEALFNRAWLLEALGRRVEARQAWERYLALEDDSLWADDARRHLNSLR